MLLCRRKLQSGGNILGKKSYRAADKNRQFLREVISQMLGHCGKFRAARPAYAEKRNYTLQWILDGNY
jgi:hypothetical protein